MGKSDRFFYLDKLDHAARSLWGGQSWVDMVSNTAARYATLERERQVSGAYFER